MLFQKEGGWEGEKKRLREERIRNEELKKNCLCLKKQNIMNYASEHIMEDFTAAQLTNPLIKHSIADS